MSEQLTMDFQSTDLEKTVSSASSRFQVGQTFKFKDTPGKEVFTILAVSAFVEMVKIDGGWVWTEGVELVEGK